MRYMLFALVVLIFAPVASAEIIFSQPESIYNVGDLFTNSISLHAVNSATDFLVVKLGCSGGEVELYRNALSITAGQTKNIELSTILGNSIIGSAGGSCTLNAKFNNEEKESQMFQLTREINLDLSLSGTLYNPGESLLIQGTAVKANGENARGFVEVLIDENNDSLSGTLNDGRFSLNYTLANNIAPGKHNVRARVFEKDVSGLVTNEGTSADEFSVRTILTRLEIETNAESIMPKNTLIYSLKAYDQADNLIEKEALVKIYSADDSVLYEKLVSTQGENELRIDGDFAPGYWKIWAKGEEIDIGKLFYVEEFEDAAFEIANKTFIVRNIGNVPYNKVLEINIGNYSILKEVNLPVNGVKKFRLSAPDDTYEINVKDGNNVVSAFNVPLTGRVVDIGEISDANFRPWAIGFFFLVLLCLGLVTNVYVKKFRERLGRKKPAGSEAGGKKLASYNISNNVASAYISGRKENAAVVALRTEAESAVIQEALAQARREGAQVYEEGDYRIITFKAKKKETTENELIVGALKISKKIAGMIEESNRNAKNKIDFGIGISRGEIMMDSARGQVASMGTAVPGAKKLARASQNNVLMSDDSYKRIMGGVKAEKFGDAWKITEVIDRERYDSFIKGFLKRQ